MCGVPVHSAELYLHRLIRKGFKVAICEQLEDPAEARQAAAARRWCAATWCGSSPPGTLTEDGLLDARQQQLAGRGGGRAAASWASPGSTSRPARSRPSPSRARRCRRRWPAWAPARSCCRSGCWASSHGLWREAGAARDAAGRRELRQHRRRAAAVRGVQGRDAGGLRRVRPGRARRGRRAPGLSRADPEGAAAAPRPAAPDRARQRDADRPGDAAQSRAAQRAWRRRARARCWRRSTAP